MNKTRTQIVSWGILYSYPGPHNYPPPYKKFIALQSPVLATESGSLGAAILKPVDDALWEPVGSSPKTRFLKILLLNHSFLV